MTRADADPGAPLGSPPGGSRAQETVLLVGNYLPSLAAARALSAAGYRVVAGDGGEYSTLRYSRHCREIWRHPPISDREGFVKALSSFLEGRPEVTLVVPLQERYVATLANARESLPGGVTLVAPEPRVVESCLDKVGMLGIAREAGVPSRAHEVARDIDSLAAAARQVGFPCVIRPADQGTRLPGDRKALVCDDPATLDRLLAAWPDGSGVLLVQGYVAGSRHNVYFIAQGGRIVMRIEARVLRTDRIDGTGLAVEEVVVPLDGRLVGYADALIERLRYTGVGSIQFMLPDVGEPSFLEVNPRHDAASAGVEACGLPVTLAAIGLATGAGSWRPDPSFRYPDGWRFAWTSRDLYGLALAVSRREIGARRALGWLGGALGSASRADAHLTWSWRDPLPSLAVYAHLASLGPWRAGRARSRTAGGGRPGGPGAKGALGGR